MSKDCYTRNKLKEISFPTKEYDFPIGSGEFIGTLVMKKWNDNLGLICYFETDTGEKLKLCVWYKYERNKAYRPKHSDTDMSEAELNTRWEIAYETNSKGKTAWLTADQIQERDDIH